MTAIVLTFICIILYIDHVSDTAQKTLARQGYRYATAWTVALTMVSAFCLVIVGGLSLSTFWTKVKMYDLEFTMLAVASGCQILRVQTVLRLLTDRRPRRLIDKGQMWHSASANRYIIIADCEDGVVEYFVVDNDTGLFDLHRFWMPLRQFDKADWRLVERANLAEWEATKAAQDSTYNLAS